MDNFKKLYDKVSEAKKQEMKAKERKVGMYLFVFFLIIVIIAMLTSCKKKNKPTQTVISPLPIVEEKLWLLDGDWKCIGGDTMFTQILHISYCCDGSAGATYYISYPIWKAKNCITVPFFYNTDSLWLDNGIIGTSSKTVLFKKL